MGKTYEQLLAEARAKETIDYHIRFIRDNLHHLRKIDKGGAMERTAQDFIDRHAAGEVFTPNQMNYVEGLYEKCWKGAGYGSVGLHADKKRRGIRYGGA